MRRTFVLTLAMTLTATAVIAQDRWNWPEQPENLQELEGFTGRQLAPVMRGFTRALGVRCSYCHVGDEGQPLSTYDFASDDNPMKRTAREMLRLLGSVNDHLEKIEPSGEKRVNMWCHTCHRGRPRPTTLAEELGEAYTAGGAGQALELYRDLHERFHGRGAYTFDEEALNTIGYQALGAEDVSGALEIFRFNADEHPESGNAWDSLAEAYMTTGQRELAIVYYQRSLALEPRNANAKEMLTKLGAFGVAPAAEQDSD